MTSTAYDIVYVAVTTSRPPVAVMQFISKAWNKDTGAVEYERPASDAAIAAEIAKAGLEVVSWRRLAGPDELPEDRVYRQAWEDDGKAIVIDPVRKAAIDKRAAEERAAEERAAEVAAPRDVFAELDALRARVAALFPAEE